MDKLEILKTFVYMHEGGFIEVKEAENMIYAYGEGDTETWWNFVLLKNPISKKELELVEEFFVKRKRKPSVYFTDDKKYDGMHELLLGEGYEITMNDSWMFWNGKCPSVEGDEIIEVKSDAEFGKFLETFLKSYPKDDPKNPYGEQKELAKLLKKSWEEGKTKKDKFYIAFDKGEPVAVGILTSYNEKGYLSGIGSIPSVRGKGFGKKISLYCVRESFKQGNKLHFLGTEKGDFPFEFYSRIGFESEFGAYFYTKK